jgi:hypothetical protein
MTAMRPQNVEDKSNKKEERRFEHDDKLPKASLV